MDDIGRLQDTVKLFTGATPSTFAYPYGCYNENTDIILRTMGFKATFSCDYGVNLIEREPECLFELKRICRSHGRGVGRLLKEAFKTLKYIGK
jgi:peptidoglycan/xylan/chitin deacetylase (PgdA/CDA1 family)